MKLHRLLTWFDVESVILRKKFAGEWPEAITGVSVYPDGIEVRIRSSEDREKVSNAFSAWFGRGYDPGGEKVHLEAPPEMTRELPVFLEIETNGKPSLPRMRPSFGVISLFPGEEDGKTRNSRQLASPTAFPEDCPPVFAFYSFKGGVGRTVHLTAFAKALSEQSHPKQTLIVDADLEAPGLTWWAREQMGEPEASFLDFLALVHYDDSEGRETSLSIVEERLRRQPLLFKLGNGGAEHFFLPAFREIDQLLRMPLRPEHLTQEEGREWLLGEMLARLGKMLDVDAVLIDLRAGLSELASPVLFDPRITRLVVTTTSGQSIEGSRIVLKQCKKVSGVENSGIEAIQGVTSPTLILSMIQEEIVDSRPIQTIREELMTLVAPEDDDGQDQLLGKEILRESFFDQKLIHLENLEKTLGKLEGTSVQALMNAIADEWLPARPPEATSASSESTMKVEPADYIRDLERLRDAGEAYEYAEQGRGDKFMAIPGLKALARKFSRVAPTAVFMGSKGAGKTFMHLQLARLKTWDRFLDIFELEGFEKSCIWPLVKSRNLVDEAAEIVRSCHENAIRLLSGIPLRSLTQSDIETRIHDMLKRGEDDESSWKKFWLSLMSDSLSVGKEGDPLTVMQSVLSDRNGRIVFIIDGLEDIFQNVGSDSAQQTALRALCQGIPNALREMPRSRIGLVVFIRKDLVKSAIRQNFGQFDALYKSYELRWNAEEALRLVAWLVSGAAGLDRYVRFEEIRKAARAGLESGLENVWGSKLGKPTSREAYTANWVIAALSDFLGQLQARDVVRLIRFAAQNALDNVKDRYPGRLIPPFAIKNALDPCSEKKVEEIQYEVSILKDIFNKLKKVPEEKRRIPFEREECGLTSPEIDEIKRLGIVLKSGEKFYMPEIFRRGLGFGLSGGARPKVLSLLKKVLR